jgi:hypothetical protein
MIDYITSYLFLLPAIKKTEHNLTEFCYMNLGASGELKQWLISSNRQAANSNQIYMENEIAYLKKLFKRLPLKMQMKKSLNIELFQDSCTTLEPYMDSACACRNTMHNYLLISYAEVVLPTLDKSQKSTFLDKLEQSVIKSRFGTNINEDYELKIIHAWKLDNELEDKKKVVHKKVSKI